MEPGAWRQEPDPYRRIRRGTSIAMSAGMRSLPPWLVLSLPSASSLIACRPLSDSSRSSIHQAPPASLIGQPAAPSRPSVPVRSVDAGLDEPAPQDPDFGDAS